MEGARQIGPYRVVSVLGQGGMGVVYRALSPNGQVVALKALLSGRGANSAQRRRFAREARALAQVEHPNVVRLLDLGDHEDAPYIVTEFHAEGSLQEALKTGPLSVEFVIRIGTQLARGLAACHARGVLHRDLKPDNVLLGEGGVPVLTDFGLAKDLGRAGETQRLTQSGTFLGSPGFWSPEQVQGQSAAIGPADIYGLGATLYAALTGRPPVVGESLIELLAATLDLVPPPIRKLRPEVPRPLADVVMRCLEKGPGDRWPSASSLGDALQEVGLAGAASSPSGLRRSKIVLFGLSLLACGLLAAALLRPASPTTNDLVARGRAAKERGRLAVAADYFRRAAERGDVSGMIGLGRVLQAPGEIQDQVQAATWYRRAAELGDSTAMTELGLALAKGRGVAPDQVQAATWLGRAAEAGDARAMRCYGDMFASGQGAPRDGAQAEAWYRRAAELGDSTGMARLGEALIRGHGASAPDPVEARTWLRRAAEQGIPGAMYNLGVMLAKGLGGERDEAEAVAWFRRAAEQGDSTAMNNLGAMLVEGLGGARDEAQGMTWLQRSAELGEPAAMYSLSYYMLRIGRRVDRDEVQAAIWCRRAAEKGHPAAMRSWGLMLEEGQGVAKDEAEAVLWYRRAAETGDARAMGRLGLMLETGRGVPKDEAEAVTWYRRAAETGDARAMALLGWMLAHGRGTPRDEAEGRRWLKRAAELGLPLAVQRLSELRRRRSGGF